MCAVEWGRDLRWRLARTRWMRYSLSYHTRKHTTALFKHLKLDPAARLGEWSEKWNVGQQRTRDDRVHKKVNATP